MKSIIDIEKKLKEDGFFKKQLDNHHEDCNVLYVSPYKTAKGIYKYIQPCLLMMDDGIACTALTGLEKYNEKKQYVDIDIPLTTKQIMWADIIVFPFTTQQLHDKNPENSLYHKIRKINEDIRIIYNVDFNYYLLKKDHAQYETFSDKNNIKNVEENIYFSDLTLCTNMLLVDTLDKKMKTLKKSKFKGIDSPARIGSFPLLIDEDMFIENVLRDEPEKNKKTEGDTVRIGIVATQNSFEDLRAFSKQLEQAKGKAKDKLEIVIFGFDGIHPETKKSAFKDDFEFTYVPPCSIVHYMRQLDILTLDALLIPLRQNEFNMTSENYNKLLEASIFKIPVITVDIFPYSEIIETGKTGVLLERKDDLIGLLSEMGMKKHEFSKMGTNLYDYVQDNLSCHPANIEIIKAIYTGKDIKKYLHNEVEEKNLDKKDEIIQKKKQEVHPKTEKPTQKPKTQSKPKNSSKKKPSKKTDK